MTKRSPDSEVRQSRCYIKGGYYVFRRLGRFKQVSEVDDVPRNAAKVDELMGLIDRLEQHSSPSKKAHEAFVTASVHQLDNDWEVNP